MNRSASARTAPPLPRRTALNRLAGLWLAACPAAGWAAQSESKRPGNTPDPAITTRPAAHGIGLIDPSVPATPLRLIGDRGQRGLLPDWLRGRTTAVQLMFTSCSATCPIQGFMFSEVCRAIVASGEKDLQLLSLSISPLEDDPAALTRWLKEQGRSAPLWQAAAPDPADYDAMLRLFGDRTSDRPDDPHTGNITFFDRNAALSFVSPEFPDPENVLRTLRALHKRR